MMLRFAIVLALFVLLRHQLPAHAAEVPVVDVAGQPLRANIRRVLEALDYLGSPLDPSTTAAVNNAARQRDAAALQALLDPQVLCTVTLNAESRVKVARGPSVGHRGP